MRVVAFCTSLLYTRQAYEFRRDRPSVTDVRVLETISHGSESAAPLPVFIFELNVVLSARVCVSLLICAHANPLLLTSSALHKRIPGPKAQVRLLACRAESG